MTPSLWPVLTKCSSTSGWLRLSSRKSKRMPPLPPLLTSSPSPVRPAIIRRLAASSRFQRSRFSSRSTTGIVRFRRQQLQSAESEVSSTTPLQARKSRRLLHNRYRRPSASSSAPSSRWSRLSIAGIMGSKAVVRPQAPQRVFSQNRACPQRQWWGFKVYCSGVNQVC